MSQEWAPYEPTEHPRHVPLVYGVLVLLMAAVVTVGVRLAIADDHEPDTSATTAPEPTLRPREVVDMRSRAAIVQLADALDAELGSSRVVAVTLYRAAAQVTVAPTDDAATRYEWNGYALARGTTTRGATETAFDVRVLATDGALIPELCGDQPDVCEVTRERLRR
ncbi:hypothetical protein GCM10022237_01670 [Nocardioides ginsengisoli]|uniref:Uncharacterized protein n=1 Tax=Nocardioides ginsengisoli TaxID=363868 RepID=A0ABW3W6Q6_9ACTN